MPQPLPSPVLSQPGPILQAMRLGEQDRIARDQRGVLQQAGQMAAQGSLGDARNTLLKHGLMQEAAQFGQMMQQADAQQREKSTRLVTTLGKLANAIDSPDKWERVKPILAQQGMDVSKYGYEDLPMLREYVASLQERAKPTDDIREYEYAQRDPRFSDWMRDTKKPLVNIDQKGETEFAKARAKQMADRVDGLEKQADAASDLSGRFQQVEDLLTDPDVYTGTGGAPIQWLKKTGTTMFGLDLEGVEEAEAAEKIQKAAVGKIREMAGDTRMSDADRKFYMETVPNIGDSPRGISLTVQLTKQLAEYKQRIALKAQEIIDKHGGVMNSKGWSELRRWQKQQSVFDRDLMQAAREEAKRTRKRGPDAGLDKLKQKYGLE